MADPAKSGKGGRARGRGLIPSETKPAGRQQASAWGVPIPAVPMVQTSSTSTGGPRPSAPGAQGRATMHRSSIQQQQQPQESRESGGNGNGATRGTVHSRRFIGDSLHSRPASIVSKKGNTGKKVTLQANYFRLLKTPKWSLYQYRVDFAPDVEVNMVRKGLLKVHKNLFKGYLFDGTVLFSTKKLDNDPTELFSNLRETEKQIKITLKFVGLLSMHEASAIQVFNIIMRGCLDGLKLQLVGRNFFDALAKIKIDNYHLELWPGYLTTIRQHEQDILLCAEVTHKVMRTDTVYDIFKRICQNLDYQDVFLKEVVGMTVLTDYNNKTYRIDDVDFKKTASSTFPTKNGDVSFLNYYKTKYNKNIKDKNQPLLISRAKARDIRGGQADYIALIPELCRVTGLSEEMRSNFHLMKELAVHTRINPGMRIQKLLQFNDRIHKTADSLARLNEWDMQLDKNIVEVLGRELNKEMICFGNQSKVPTDKKADWTSQFRNIKLFSVIELKRWCAIVPSKQTNEARDFVKALITSGRGMGFMISEPVIKTLADDRPPTYMKALDDAINSDPQLVMCVVSNNRADRYSAIKKKCCVDRAIPTQVMCGRTISNARGLMSVATKVAIQMNCKLGAAPWMVEMPLSGLMTIGFDVCHDSQDKSKSYGAMVATMDLKSTPKYFSAVTAHRNGEELSNSFSLNIVKALAQYRQEHGTLPSRILIYRDGVGEGQINYVYEHEVNIIKERLEKIYLNANITEGLRLAFVIVSKRINTRIFQDRMNPSPGTVVDDVITLPERYDFFLVSQSVGQGSVAPTMYNIIHDNMGLPPDKMQILTYKMCHLYYNWSGTTRVPAMCQYAHKLATLVGQFIHQDPSNLLEKQLYFL